MCVDKSFARVCVLCASLVLSDARGRIASPRTGVENRCVLPTWVLVIKPRSSERAARAHNHSATSPVPDTVFMAQNKHRVGKADGSSSYPEVSGLGEGNTIASKTEPRRGVCIFVNVLGLRAGVEIRQECLSRDWSSK